MPFLEPVTLQGAHARLEPLSHDHAAGLVEAVNDGELWKLWYTFIPTYGVGTTESMPMYRMGDTFFVTLGGFSTGELRLNIKAWDDRGNESMSSKFFKYIVIC